MVLSRVFKLSGVMVLTIAGVAIAGDNRVTIHTRHRVMESQVTHHNLNTHGSGLASVIQRRVVDPDVVVGAALSRQPVHDHLIEVQVGHTTVYLDPSRDYARQHRNVTLTHRNYIAAAIQKHQSLTCGGVKLIRGIDHTRQMRSRVIFPKMILLPRPDLAGPNSDLTRSGRSGPQCIRNGTIQHHDLGNWSRLLEDSCQSKFDRSPLKLVSPD